MKKLAILSVFVIVMLACCYGQRTETTKASSYFSKKIECARLAAAKRERDARANAGDGIFMPAEQCYAPSLDTCIYEDNFIARDHTTMRNLIDLATSRSIASYMSADGGADDRRRFDEFMSRRRELFSKCADVATPYLGR